MLHIAHVLSHVQNRPQCATCGVMSNNLTTVVCRNCIEFYSKPLVPCHELDTTKILSLGSLDTLPKDVFMIPGLLPLLVKPTEDDPREVNQTFEVQRTSSSGSTAVLDLASNFQKTASSSRLGNKPKTGFSLGQYGNIKKAQMVNAERRAKKEDHLQQESTDGPKITVTLWVAFADPEALTFSMKMVNSRLGFVVEALLAYTYFSQERFEFRESIHTLKRCNLYSMIC